jgi:AcrR family transcriptional regulator
MPRSPARRHELLAGAERAFARRGYFGTSTAQVAAEAGVSQPYIVQVFGSKLELFVQTHQFAGDKILQSFRVALAENGFDPPRVGAAYLDLVLRERAAVLVFAHAFSASSEPRIGVEARRLFGEIHALLLDAGATEEGVVAFMGRGMIINTMLLMDTPQFGAEHGLTAMNEIVLGRR